MKIALFITCLTETYYPRVGIAVVKILEHLGYEVVFPAGQTCCGQPLYNNGYHDDARLLAEKMVRVFEQYEVVVTPSGSCAAMIRDYYPGLFPEDSPQHRAAVNLANKTYEFVEFIHNVVKIDLTGMGAYWPGRVTYHYSCHLRGLGMTDEAVSLAQQIRGLEYIPLEKQDQCCGFGGTFALKYPQVSSVMIHDKVDCIRAAKVENVICNDAGCSMNISGACNREGVSTNVISLAEIIAESLGLLPRQRGAT